MIIYGHQEGSDQRWVFSSKKSPLDTHIIDAEPRRMECKEHFPKDWGVQDKMNWYEQICSKCDKPIFPASWKAK